jgi:hypothetical protein
VVSLPESVKVTPRTKQVLVGRLEGPKGSETPQLVCVKPARLRYAGVWLAQGVSRPVLQSQRHSTASVPGAVSARTPDGRSWRSDSQKVVLHVMVVNFSREEIELPKHTVLGVAEEVSAYFLLHKQTIKTLVSRAVSVVVYSPRA